MRLSEYIPDLQDRLRRLGYARFSESHEENILLPTAGAPNVAWASKYQFVDRDAKRAVVLSPGFVTYEVTSYRSFEEFAESWTILIETVGQILEPAFAERIGLRYVDLIQPRESETLEAWLQEGLHGLSGLPLRNVQSQLELRGQTDLGQFVFRATKPRTGFVPADLQPFELTVEASEPLRDGSYMVLDFDHFSPTPRDFRVGELLDGFWALHDFVDLAFRATVTRRALAEWGVQA